jgi:hypothetical protein
MSFAWPNGNSSGIARASSTDVAFMRKTGDEARFNRINEIGGVHAFHGLLDRINFLKVAYDDFRAEVCQCFGSIIDGMSHSADDQSCF